MTIYQPYTYLIGWSKLNIWYYGVRYAENCIPEDLWVTYFTSSNRVLQAREYCGEPNIIQIRKIFLTREKAIDWEQKLIKRAKLHLNENFLNKGAHRAFDIPTEILRERAMAHNITDKARTISRNKMLGDKNPMKNPEIARKSMDTKIRNDSFMLKPFGRGKNHIWNLYPESLEKRRTTMTGRHWYNNGLIQKQLHTCPEGWKQGKFKKIYSPSKLLRYI